MVLQEVRLLLDLDRMLDPSGQGSDYGDDYDDGGGDRRARNVKLDDTLGNQWVIHRHKNGKSQ